MWFDATGDECTLQAGCPVFCFDTADGFFYGFPRIDDDGVKVGEHTGGELVDHAAQVDRTLHPCCSNHTSNGTSDRRLNTTHGT